ncbi:MAG: hypothetical protein WD317_06255 [Balneolaceae bacterium]
MQYLSRFLFIGLFLLSAIQCTSTRWAVTDLQAVDERQEPELVRSRFKVLKDDSVSVSNPFLNLNLYRIDEFEYTRRILVERTVQQYRPKWGFALLGTLGASIAFYAGNTDGFIENFSRKQALALNTTGVLLSTIALTNMKPVGEAIRTGETKYLRRSGSVMISDTTGAVREGGVEVHVGVTYKGDSLMQESYSTFGENGLNIRLTSLIDRPITGMDPGELDVTIIQRDEENRFSIPVSSFMSPVIVVSTPVAELRNRPVYDESPAFTEVGNGSELILIDNSDERWYQVRLGGSNLFIARESGEIHWKEEQIIEDPSIFTVDEVPFGELDIEFSTPVLKPESTTDVAVLFSNHRNNQLGIRRYLERDLRLMELYFRESLGVASSRMHNREIIGEAGFAQAMEEVDTDTSSTVYAYISGFAKLEGEGPEAGVSLVHHDENGNVSTVDLEEILSGLASGDAEKMVAFMDLQFAPPHKPASGSNSTDAYRQIAGSVSAQNENSALVFSSRPDQTSGLFESLRYENRYHHIFPYFVAQALQQRKTTLSELVRHVENQVEYTSRRLYDRPQTIQAYGNLSINLEN